MLAEFLHTLRRLRGQVIGWGIGLALYGVLMASFYPTISGIKEGFMELLKSYPKELLAFFGSIMELDTPKGYLDTYFFNYMTVIVGILAVSGAASLLVGDEERGILDLVLAHPISRRRLFWGRLLALAVAIALVLVAGYLAWAIPSGSSGLHLTWLALLRPFLPLAAELLLFGALALLLSMLLPSGRTASMLSGALLVANYLVLGLSNINERLRPIVKFTPLYYYQGGKAIDGLDWTRLGGLLGVSLLLAFAAWALFEQREIRVGGEHGWRLSRLIPRLRR